LQTIRELVDSGHSTSQQNLSHRATGRVPYYLDFPGLTPISLAPKKSTRQTTASLEGQPTIPFKDPFLSYSPQAAFTLSSVRDSAIVSDEIEVPDALLNRAISFVHGGIHPNYSPLFKFEDPVGNINRIGRGFMEKLTSRSIGKGGGGLLSSRSTIYPSIMVSLILIHAL
jgi:hypothetical protein